MNTIKQLWDKYQAKRIDRILNWPASRILGNRWVKRSLASIAVVSSWAYLALLTPGLFNALSSSVPFQLLSGLVMISSFLMLRQSVKRITSLPDEYLDEREIENRDWAYRLGYLVVRRIGLVLTLALVVFGFLVKFGSYSITVDGVTKFPQSLVPEAYEQASDFIRRFFALSPIEDLLLIMVLLTYVAYSFPVILLAWRESTMQPIPQPNTDWRDPLRRYSKGYFARVLRAVSLFTLSYISFLLTLKELWINLTVLSVFYSIYVYFWGVFFQFEILGKLKPFVGKDSIVKKKYTALLVLAYSAAFLGASILVSNWISGDSNKNLFGVFAVIIIIVLHLVSFSMAAKLAKPEVGSK